MNLLVTIIIPCLNEEKTIVNTIDSLLIQDYEPIEIIIVDDGSSDNTIFKLISTYSLIPLEKEKEESAYAKTAYKIYCSKINSVSLFLIIKKNSGKAESLNVGINYSHGSYIACIDSDCFLFKSTIKQLVSCIESKENVVGVGGRIIALHGLYSYLKNNRISLKSILLAHQSIEYALAFLITRPILDKIGTSLIISGAIGFFKRETLIKTKGYCNDTLGEDMELVFRIRKYYAKRGESYSIDYAKEAKCITELPFTILDFVKQRIRWAIGLSEVLAKHRSLGYSRKYSFLQRLTYWYYLLFEKYIPLFELIWSEVILILYLLVGITPIIFTVNAISLVLVFISSWKIIKKALMNTDHIVRTVIRTYFIIFTFLTAYHFMHSSIRLYALIKYSFTRDKKHNKNSWKSPKREGL